MNIGRVFGAVGVLRPTDRFELGVLLVPPHRRFPVTATEFEALPQPEPGAIRRQFLVRLAQALSRSVDGPLAEWQLGTVIPLLGTLHGAVETSPEVTNRLLALVRAQSRRSWSDLAEPTVGDIREWPGAGVTLTARLITAGVEAALRAGDKEPPWVGLFAEDLHGSDGPDDLADTGRPPRSPVVVALDTCLASVRDQRARIAFQLDDLRLDGDSWPNDLYHDDRFGPTPTRARLTAELVGVGYEAVRQMRFHARRQARELAERDEVARATIDDLAARLGELANEHSIAAALQALSLPTIDDPAGLLALFLAGPYRPVPGHRGWWSPRPNELLVDTNRLLTGDGGVHHRPALVTDLAHLGMADDLAEAWLACQPVRQQDGLVVYLVGRSCVIAERALEATGRAMSTAELKQWMSSADTAGTLAAELHRNRRFVQTEPDRWELTEWGGQQSTQVVRFRIPVTPDSLTGDESDAPGELVGLLGLRPGKPTSLTTRYGPMTLVYDGDRVVRRSARPILLASGAIVGDVLIMVVNPVNASAEVEIERCSPDLDQHQQATS